MIFGVDLSPEYQAGFSIEQAHREGIRFVGVKLSDGTKGTERYEEGIDWVRRARFLRMVALGYHFLRAETPAADQVDMLADQIGRAGGIPAVLDCERGSVDLLREVAWGLVRRRVRVAFTYLPRWYWQGLASAASPMPPSLAGMAPLWASRFVVEPGRVPVTERTGTPAEIATGIDPTWWEGYGGQQTSLLQFTRKATVAGMVVDADAYRGSLADLEREVAWTPQRAYR